MKHILSAKQFDKKTIGTLFEKADEIRSKRQVPSVSGKVVATLFYEPSTRTRLSFESAAQRLGHGLISTENANEASSATKGETIEDTIRTMSAYADAVVLRHKVTGAAETAAAASLVPIINAGDGKGEHPTQALLDLYTIRREKGRTDNLRVVIGGDLAHGRTARSLAQLTSLYEGNHIVFVAAPELQIGEDIKKYLDQHNTTWEEADTMQAVANADVVYWTRLQKERLSDPSLESNFVINKKVLEILPEDAVILHPLPRVDEIAVEVDNDPRAAYFRQVENGLYIRMALLEYVLA